MESIIEGFSLLPNPTKLFIFSISVMLVYANLKFDQRSVHLWPTILTITGIFGTFLGIAIGLANFDTNKIQESVPALLAGMKTAFWASVAGVGGALMIK